MYLQRLINDVVLNETMNTADKVAIHDLPIDLQCIKEDLITTDSINQLDIADGLKELLISKSFTLKLLLDTPVSDLAKILGIDDYIASVIRYAARKVVKDQHSDRVSGVSSMIDVELQ